MSKNTFHNPSKKHLESRLSLEIFLPNKLINRNFTNSVLKHRNHRASRHFLSLVEKHTIKGSKMIQILEILRFLKMLLLAKLSLHVKAKNDR